MRTPLFWYEAPGLRAGLLRPLAAVYAAGTRRRLARGPRKRLSRPVICVGNLAAGGTGKTPTVIALAERMISKGGAPHAVTRGYGGSLMGPVRVDPTKHRSDQVGDEALLLAAFLPTWVAKDRAAGAAAAIENGADSVILDDGYQNPALAYDKSIVVVDALRGFGNGQVIPSGPLREPVHVGLSRADLVLAIGPEAAQDVFEQDWANQISIPIVRGQLDPLPTGLPMQGLPVLAFAGIGHPEKFFMTLKAMGADVLSEHALSDHQPLTGKLMGRMMREARGLGAQVVTTEKDAVRLPSHLRSQVMTIPVRLTIEDWGFIDAALADLV
jgi:tetraacyldisaccharide 4'-kinase